MAELTTQTVAPVLPRAQNRVLKKFLANKSAVIGAVIVGFFVLVALLAPWIAPFDPVKANFLAVRKAPSAMYWFGTDELGRDILSRIIWGARTSLMAGCMSVVIAVVIGVPLGLVAGYFQKMWDGVISRVIEALLACPFLIMAIALGAFLGPSLTNAMIAIGLSAMPIFARLTRGRDRHSQRRVHRRRAGDRPAGSLDHHQICPAERHVTHSGAGHAGHCLGNYRRSQSLVSGSGAAAAKPLLGLNA